MKKIVLSILFITITLNANTVENDCRYQGFKLGYKYGLVASTQGIPIEDQYLPTPKQIRNLKIQINDCLERCGDSNTMSFSVYWGLKEMQAKLNELANHFEEYVLENKIQFDYKTTQLWDKRLEIK